MNLSQKQKLAIISAISEQREHVVAERNRKSNDYSQKWNDGDHSIARQLDAERDWYDLLLKELEEPSGSITW